MLCIVSRYCNCFVDESPAKFGHECLFMIIILAPLAPGINEVIIQDSLIEDLHFRPSIVSDVGLRVLTIPNALVIVRNELATSKRMFTRPSPVPVPVTWPLT